MSSPRIVDDPAYRDLLPDDFKRFSEYIAGRKLIDFANTDLPGFDFRVSTSAN